MKKKIIIAAIFAAIVILVYFSRNVSEVFLLNDKINGDFTLILTKRKYQKYYNKVTVKNGDEQKTHYFKGKMTLNIWKTDWGHINDENETLDIAFGVYNIAPHHRKMFKRVFIYKVEGVELVPKFRCSRLATPMVDFILYDYDEDGYDEIVSIEKYKGKYTINAYKEYNLTIERVFTKEIQESEANIKNAKNLLKDR